MSKKWEVVVWRTDAPKTLGIGLEPFAVCHHIGEGEEVHLIWCKREVEDAEEAKGEYLAAMEKQYAEDHRDTFDPQRTGGLGAQ